MRIKQYVTWLEVLGEGQPDLKDSPNVHITVLPGRKIRTNHWIQVLVGEHAVIDDSGREDPEESLIWQIEIGIEPGFISDGYSLPFVCRWFTDVWSGPDVAPIVHDWLYQTGALSRKAADQLLLAIMKKAGAGIWRRWIYYAGVRVGGWWVWRKYRKADRR